ncbi:dihydrolipoamide acetyltransferase family protein [Planomonospora corallina]|uniref:Dihydrolipoamide acetyltransferase component of pyruvate dehydrogenase complex n=1 Tax=Planomonospora corallina TaxID=1806052 RepID=A0ABV8IEW2_9ACTN
MKEFKLPDVGEGLTEAEIVRWHVKPGDPVEVNQTIVEIETAKAVVELPCPFEGVVAALLAEEGETVDVGRPIIAVDDGSGPAAQAPARPPAERQALAEDMVPAIPADSAGGPGGTAGAGDPAGKRQPVLVGYGVKPGASRRRPRKQSHAPQGSAASPAAPARPAAAPAAGSTGASRNGVPAAPGGAAQAPAPVRPAQSSAQVPSPGAAPAPGTAPGEGRVAVLAKPPVRKLAKDLGIDLATITGTGPQGSITRDDVHAALEAAREPARQAAPAAAGGEERVPIRGVRKATAQAMVASAFTAPHVTEFLQIDMTATMEAVVRLRAMEEFAGVKVSPLLLVAKALLVAVRRHPMVNSAWDEAAQGIVVKHYVNLGIAAATPRGLLVPNVKDAHALSLPELAAALTSLAETARAGRTQPADMAGGTITITNVGVFGVDAGTPILNPGESAILALGQVRDLPWVVDGQIVPRKVCTLALSFDHRVVDGELGSLFLRDIGAMLEDPLRMLAWG